MTIGALFLVVSFALWFLTGIGVHTIPNVEVWAHASLVLGILLGGYPFPIFFHRPPPA